MNHELIEHKLKQVIIDLASETNSNLSTLTPDDIIYILNENDLFVVEIENNEN